MLFDGFAPDVEVLVRKCKAGDVRAWGQLVDRFQALVWSTIRRTGLSPEDSEDVFQSVFLTLHRNLDRIDSAVTLPKWLATTASREAIRRHGADLRAKSKTTSDQGLDEFLAAEDQAVDDLILEAESALAVRDAVGHMPANCRDLLTALYLSEEASYQEISDRFGIAIGSIGPKRARCLDRLRKMLLEKGFFPDVSDQSTRVS